MQSLQTADKNMACHGCHGDGAQFLAARYTPLQTGGFSDEDLQGAITSGSMPQGSTFVTTIPPQITSSFTSGT